MSESYFDLAKYTGETLEAEANFSPEDWEPGDDIPSDISDYLPDGWDLSSTTGIDADEALDDMRQALSDAMESWRESVDCLDVRAEVSVYGGEVTVNDVTLVLGTGGPHVEVTLDSDGDGRVIAYGWFGAGRAEYPVSIAGHPLMSIVELTIETLDTLNRVGRY